MALAALMLVPALPQAQPAQKPAPKSAQKPASKPAAKPAQKPASKPSAPQHAKSETPKSATPTLLGQYGDWGAYSAAPGGKTICFAIAKPVTMLPTGVNRDPAYLFISTRPADKVKEEVSVILGYPAKPDIDATAQVGAASFAMYTQKDGAWVKNAADEAKLVTALRGGAEAVIRAQSSRGTKTTDTYSLKGLSQALDRVAQECK